MKTTMLSLLSMFLLGTLTLFAQGKKEKFEVKGNCGMCERSIEKAAKAVEGVTAADWSQKTKKMEVNFDESKTTLAKIQMAIAKAGYDTPLHKATVEDYNKLPGCCKYDRTAKAKEEKKNDHGGHVH